MPEATKTARKQMLYSESAIFKGRLKNAQKFQDNLIFACNAFQPWQLKEEAEAVRQQIVEKAQSLQPLLGQVGTDAKIEMAPKEYSEIASLVARRYNGQFLTFPPTEADRKFQAISIYANNMFDILPVEGDQIVIEIIKLCLKGVQLVQAQ
jgi:hypothetical protein